MASRDLSHGATCWDETLSPPGSLTLPALLQWHPDFAVDWRRCRSPGRWMERCPPWSFRVTGLFFFQLINDSGWLNTWCTAQGFCSQVVQHPWEWSLPLPGAWGYIQSTIILNQLNAIKASPYPSGWYLIIILHGPPSTFILVVVVGLDSPVMSPQPAVQGP